MFSVGEVHMRAETLDYLKTRLREAREAKAQADKSVNQAATEPGYLEAVADSAFNQGIIQVCEAALEKEGVETEA